jgi:hypothetical protein
MHDAAPSNLTDCGLPGIRHIPYGVHMCHFYRGRDELAALLVPYFAAGLRNRERCIRIAAEPLDAAAARLALAQAGVDVVRRHSCTIEHPDQGWPILTRISA